MLKDHTDFDASIASIRDCSDRMARLTRSLVKENREARLKRRGTEADRARALLATLVFPETIHVGGVALSTAALAEAVATEAAAVDNDPDDGWTAPGSCEIVRVRQLEKNTAEKLAAGSAAPVHLDGDAARECCAGADVELCALALGGLDATIIHLCRIDPNDAALVLVLGVLMYLAGADAQPNMLAAKPTN